MRFCCFTAIADCRSETCCDRACDDCVSPLASKPSTPLIESVRLISTALKFPANPVEDVCRKLCTPEKFDDRAVDSPPELTVSVPSLFTFMPKLVRFT